MKAVLAVLCLATLAVAVPTLRESEYQSMFTRYVAEYNKAYSTNEFFARYNTFKNNVDYIRSENNKNNSYTLGMNQFGDLTQHEFKTQVVGGCFMGSAAYAAPTAPNGRAPSPVDWVAKGHVQKIKNQGQCGSCWSFSTTGSVEGDVFIEAGVLTSLSEQQLVDCSTAQGNQGCNGGLMDNAFQYIISNGGLTTEAGYPYTATGPNTCSVTTPLASTITSYCDVTSGSETALINAVAQQPVSVAIEADQSCFQFYSSGVMSDPSCGTQLDHGVLAVGFGVVGGVKYWNVKNSWGTSWGNNGYIWLGRQVAGQPLGVCGIASEPSFPYGGSSLSGRTAARHHHKH